MISPYAEARDEARVLCSKFFEIHVATPLEVCEERDPKGLYARVREGAIKGFTGIDDPYEPPVHPDLVVNTNMRTVTECSRSILDLCFRKFNP
jgi:adenylylsulfate kinase